MLRVVVAGVSAVLALAGGTARAEPYLAVQTGVRCAMCHVNQTGGGMRTPFGNAFAQTQLAAHRGPAGIETWTGRVGSYFSVGANVRAAAIRTDVADTRQSEALDWREARLYVAFTPIAERLSFYVDQRLRPGAAQNREAFVLYRGGDGSHHLKAGRIYLPFGWRLQDNSAFVRSQTAIDMTGPDLGVEAGWDAGPFSLQVAISNGTFGQSEVDDGKQVSLQAAWLQDSWRLGVAANVNNRDIGDRAVAGVFGGLRTGPVSWLAELDVIEDRSAVSASGRRLRSFAWLFEGNWSVAKGHNLKATLEGLDPDRDGRPDQQSRISAVYEYTPIPLLQLRGGTRRYEGPSRVPVYNRHQYFVELHGFF